MVLAPGLAPSRPELLKYCQQRLAGYKVPDEITARDDLPHNMSDKVLRRVLRDEAAAAHALT